MLTTIIVPFLCGSLAATIVFAVIIFRQGIIDERLIRHIRSTAYNKGWKDGKNSQFQGE